MTEFLRERSQIWIKTYEIEVSKANPELIKDLVIVVADKLNMTPLADSEPVCMVDEESELCEGNVDHIIKCSAELSAPDAPYTVISIIGAQGSGKSYLRNCLFGTKFHEIGPGDGRHRRGIMMSRCIGPSLFLLDFEGLRRGGKEEDTIFQKQAVLFALIVSDLVIVNMPLIDIGLENGCSTLLFKIIFQERTKLAKGSTKILVVLRDYDGEPPLETLRSDLEESLDTIWESVHEKYVKFKDNIEVNVVTLPRHYKPTFTKEVAVLRKLLSKSVYPKVPASSFLVNARTFWGAVALKDVAEQLATRLQFQEEKGREAWSQLRGKLVKGASAIAVGNTRTAVEALLEVAKDASAHDLLVTDQVHRKWSQTLIITYETGVSKANPDLLRDLVIVVADKLNMTPLADSEPVCMVDEESEFCEGNVDRIIKCSAELSAPNAPYTVISIIGAQGSGKSYLLNCFFGTKFHEIGPGDGRRRRGIMMSRCIGPSLLLLDFEGLRRGGKEEDTTFQKQATLFALTVSDLVIVNMPLIDIGRENGCSTLLFKIIFQERAKLPQGVTKILVVVRYYNGEPQLETLRINVQTSLEKIWESVNLEDMKFNDYFEVNTTGLRDNISSNFQEDVTFFRKLLTYKTSAKVPASSFSVSSSILWDSIRKNKQLDVHQFYPGESIFPSKSSITSEPSSGHAEASSSTRSNNYLSAMEPTAIPFHELHRMTDGFSAERLLGTGAYGMVYKGLRENGEVIAVKKLNNCPGLVEKSFMNELLNLMVVQHKNIIRLVGYCSETRDKIVEYDGKLLLAGEQERVLCLEYMEGGTLEELLSDESWGLDWETRYEIIKGICQGLKHLHAGCKNPIYHLDLKPANILLDEHQIPKIGDFGLSRLLGSMQTRVTKTVLGTVGYVPPEYINEKIISGKFDIYSLGVIIIEVIAGRKNYYKSANMPAEIFTELVTENWRKRVQAETMSTEALLEVQKCIKIALRCVVANRENRPTITEIVEELNRIDPLRADARDETTSAALCELSLTGEIS